MACSGIDSGDYRIANVNLMEYVVFDIAVYIPISERARCLIINIPVVFSRIPREL